MGLDNPVDMTAYLHNNSDVSLGSSEALFDGDALAFLKRDTNFSSCRFLLSVSIFFDLIRSSKGQVMPLKILLSSTLRKYLPDYDPLKGLQLELDEETTVADVCKKIRVPQDKIRVIMVNGKNASLEYKLTGDDRLALFPSLGGG